MRYVSLWKCPPGCEPVVFSDASFAYQEGIFADPVPPTRPFSAKPGLARPWACDAWMEQDVWLPVRGPCARRWCNRPATGEMNLSEIHLREYLASVYRNRSDASTLPTYAIMPLSGF